MATLVLLGLTVIGFLILLDRKDSRTSETMQTTLGAHRLELLGLLERSERERDAHRREVAELLQRIQAPQLAVHEHAAMAPVHTPAAVDTTDDEDYWKAQEEAIERIQTLEREGL